LQSEIFNLTGHYKIGDRMRDDKVFIQLEFESYFSTKVSWIKR